MMRRLMRRLMMMMDLVMTLMILRRARKMPSLAISMMGFRKQSLLFLNLLLNRNQCKMYLCL